MAYPYEQYQAGITGTADPYSQQIRDALNRGAGFGIAGTALEAFDMVKNGHMVPIVLFDPNAPMFGPQR